ncbi:MAG: hypothetical protein O2954_13385, partial [bacterium]|nr:hypothetical protein [bacterium]
AIQEADYVTRLNATFKFRKDSAGSNLQTYYSTDGYIFSRVGERTFAVNNLGIAYAHRLPGSKNLLSTGSVLSLRLDRSYYDIYDYTGLKSYLNAKVYLRPSLLFRAGYSLSLRKYWNMDASRYVDHDFSLQLNRFFSTRTTLRTDFQYGYKTHNGPEAQILFGFQIAQSLAEDTGLSLRYQARFNTTAKSNNELENIYLQDDDLLADRYDYGGHEWTARLTQQLPAATRLLLEGGYEIRNYQTQSALDLYGLPTSLEERRQDRNASLSAIFEVPLTPALRSQIGYTFDRNLSNDLYYNYPGRHSLSVNFDINF